MKVKKICKKAGEDEVRSESMAPGEEKGSARTVVVGIRMDAQSRELLTWSLVKVAQTGDRVIALHVLPNSSSKSRDAASSLLSLISSFDSVLAAYNGFCNLRQIDLKLKVCRGSSLRKALVREAAAADASHIVLGVAKGSHGIGHSSSVSIAKYCAKKVPQGCGVVAVSNGKIAFEKPSWQLNDEGSFGRSKKVPMLLDARSNDNMLCVLQNRPDRVRRMIGDDGKLGAADFTEESCPICSKVSGNPQVGDIPVDEEGGGAVLMRKVCQVSGGESVQEESRGQQGGLVVQGLSMHERKISFSEKTLNRVQWAMRLPSLFSAADDVHPHQKLIRIQKNGKREGDACSKDASKFARELEFLVEKYSSVCRVFTYKELSNATDDFAVENLIGKGGNSCVYMGFFSDEKRLAVKVLKQTCDTVKEFSMEVEIITSLCHKNIVSLVGFSFDNSNLFLVYDLLPRGSLDKHLHDVKDDDGTVLLWDQRYKIAVGVAEALEHLHSGCGRSQPAIHRDVKSSNILLSEDFEPQLSDFGLATWGSSSSSIITSTNVAGTFGYLAPEYFVFGKVNEKIDVYAFGVVLLELLTGRKPIESECPKGQESLVIWAKPFLSSEKGKQLLDPKLGTKYDAEQVELMVLATTLCIRRAPKLRPKMSNVLNLLHGNEDEIRSARSKVKASEELEGQDDEASYPISSDLRSHLSLAFLDVDDDSLSVSSASHSTTQVADHGSLEAYLHARCGHFSSSD